MGGKTPWREGVLMLILNLEKTKYLQKSLLLQKRPSDGKQRKVHIWLDHFLVRLNAFSCVLSLASPLD